MRIKIKLHFCHRGNWIINLTALLCNFNIIISCDSNNGTKLPENWPCSWNSGVVPFIFNYYSLSPKRLISLVQRGHAHIEQRSCLKFKKYNPVELLNKTNFTFLFYTYSGVLENCCLPFYTKSTGRRLVLITPVCTLPIEVAHVTLHGLGLEHQRHEAFSEVKTKAVLFPTTCPDAEKKFAVFKNKRDEDVI